jgi:hypothetical protein
MPNTYVTHIKQSRLNSQIAALDTWTSLLQTEIKSFVKSVDLSGANADELARMYQQLNTMAELKNVMARRAVSGVAS